MIYLTNDALDQAVYFEFRGKQPLRNGVERGHLVYGIVGNGVTEVAVTVRKGADFQEVVFGRDDLFSVVDERALRRMLGEAAREIVLH